MNISHTHFIAKCLIDNLSHNSMNLAEAYAFDLLVSLSFLETKMHFDVLSVETMAHNSRFSVDSGSIVSQPCRLNLIIELDTII